jgi:hypothetical protein
MEKAKAYALSDDDIRRLLGSDIKITSYPDLEKVQHINEIFDRKGRAVLFFPQQSKLQGHWSCLVKNGREIEFFDPYGEAPEDQKEGLSGGDLERLGMTQPLLANLLLNSGSRIYFNKVQIQELNNDVQTCGRHVVARLMYYKFPVNKYRQIISKSGLSPDEYAVQMTAGALGK